MAALSPPQLPAGAVTWQRVPHAPTSPECASHEVQLRDASDRVHRVLVVRARRAPFALRGVLDARCSHLGAPLIAGVTCRGRVTCPWHGASFTCTTGDVEDMPALRPIRSYHAFATEDDDDAVFIAVDAQQRPVPVDRAAASSDSKPLTAEKVLLVVGGGAAGFAAVLTAVEDTAAADARLRIVFVCEEAEAPYDRTKLSKSMEAAPLRAADWYSAHGIELRLCRRVVRLDLAAAASTAELDDGSLLRYDSVVLAAGARARRLDMVPGSRLRNVLTLRSVADARDLLARADCSRRVVIVGAGFIGLEVAAILRRNTDVETIRVLSRGAVPLAHVLGDRIGRFLQTLHEEHNIQFHMRHTPVEFQADASNSHVVAVRTASATFEADLVLLALGVSLNTEFISGIELHGDERSVLVDEHFQVKQALPGRFAAGDLAKFPLGALRQPARIEHWSVALNQGRVAARNALSFLRGEPLRATLDAVPFFWTVHYGASLRFVGHIGNAVPDDVVIDGDLDGEKKFVAFYISGDRVSAVCTWSRDPVAAAAAELLRIGRMPSPCSVRKAGAAAVLRALEREDY